MKYKSAIQTPNIVNDRIIGWTLRVSAEHEGKVGEVEEYAELPLEQQLLVREYTPEMLSSFISKISEERNMPYRAAKIAIEGTV